VILHDDLHDCHHARAARGGDAAFPVAFGAVWDTAEKIGFIVLIGVVMVVILRSSGELGSRALSVSRPAHFEGQPAPSHSDTAEVARAGEHGGPAGDSAHGDGYAAYNRASNVGRQVVILVGVLIVLLAVIWIGTGSLGIFWY
jgi:hypothetical protein